MDVSTGATGKTGTTVIELKVSDILTLFQPESYCVGQSELYSFWMVHHWLPSKIKISAFFQKYTERYYYLKTIQNTRVPAVIATYPLFSTFFVNSLLIFS